MTEPINDLDHDSVVPEGTAIFLDFDGTLVEFADHPNFVQLAPETRDAVRNAYHAVDGALAIITGRNISDIDQYFAPLRLPVAGVHGLTRRGAKGELHNAATNASVLSAIADELENQLTGEEGLLIERKSGSIALHYRLRPDLEETCVAAVDRAVAAAESIHLMRGKMVIEAKIDGCNKGNAVEDFLSEQPFSGRVPLFAGDDVTDEDAFQVVNALNGMTIKVGPGDTHAQYRADSTADFLDWLYRLANHRTEGTKP